MRRRMMAVFLAVSLTALAGAACAGDGADADREAPETEVAEAAPIGDPILRGWQLTAFGPAAELGDEAATATIRETLADLDPDTPITLGLEEEGRAAGFSGCNRYFGDFQIRYGHQIAQGPMAGTMMACPDGFMQLERAYLSNLAAAMRLFRRDGRLELESDAGVLLLFAPAAQPAEAAE